MLPLGEILSNMVVSFHSYADETLVVSTSEVYGLHRCRKMVECFGEIKGDVC